MGKRPDYDKQATEKAWEYYVKRDHPIPQKIDGVRQVVTDSWRRSQQYAHSENRAPSVLSPEDLQRALDENSLLIRIALPYLQEFYELFKDSQHLMFLNDPQGYLLETIGSVSYIDDDGNERVLSLERGTNFSEEVMGTNGVGTALAANEPVVIFGEEHYGTFFRDYACNGAPIYDPAGRLLGCIDITGPLKAWDSMIMGILQVAISGIEKQFELTRKNGMLDSLVESFDRGVLMLDHENKVVFSNEKAKTLLGLDDEVLKGKPFYSLVRKDSMPLAIRGLDMPITDEDCSLLNSNGLRIDVSLTIKPDQSDSHGVGSTLILLCSQTHVHQLANKLAGLTAVFHFDAFEGASEAHQRVISMGKIISGISDPILLFGEEGTGKSVLAQAIHNAGHNSEGPFVEVDCTAVPPATLRGELFGHTNPKTGTRIPGKMELAKGGTLYIDRVSALPTDLQKELVDIIKGDSQEDGEAGEGAATPFRLIASTRKNLLLETQRGAFREDLYYILNAFTITIPPLRERQEDIIVMARAFASRAAGNPVQFSDECMEALASYPWPGNVRELESAMRLSIDHPGQSELTLNDLPAEITTFYFAKTMRTAPSPDESSQGAVTEQSETSQATAADAREYYAFTKALREAKGNATEAAERLGLPLSTFYRRLHKLNIRPKDFREF